MVVHVHVCLLVRVGAQLGLAQMITIEIRIPNRLVGLGKYSNSVCDLIL